MKSISLFLIAILALTQNIFGQAAPGWNNAFSFGLLAGKDVTLSGGANCTGNLGAVGVFNWTGGSFSNGTSYTGGHIKLTNAMVSANETYNNLKTQSGPTTDLSGKILGQSAGALVLEPGIYTFSGAAQLSGALVLDDKGDPNAVFIFRIGTALTGTANSTVKMKSGTAAPWLGPNVFWQVGTTADLTGVSVMVGNILASSDINTSTSFFGGKLFSLNGSINFFRSANGNVVPAIIDSDGDGVSDMADDFPLDARWAHIITIYNTTLAFEDQWPLKGDFDMNDLVITHRYTSYSNAANQIRHVIADFTLKATGGKFDNGFAVEFPFAANKVSNVTGATQESGQAKAVMVLFNNMHTEMATWNTIPGQPKTPDRFYRMEFDSVDTTTFNYLWPSINPFIFGAGTSRREVHLVGQRPTSLADFSLFGTGDDSGTILTRHSYKTKTGLPYALSFTDPFSYPIEGKDISLAYPYFSLWAKSDGNDYLNWYRNPNDGFRVNSLIYSK